MRNKYHNQKVRTAAGNKFDSRLELKVYAALQRNPIVNSIERQKTFELMPGFRKCPGCGETNLVLKSLKKCPKCGGPMSWIAPIKYVADFVITTTDNRMLVVEAKGRWTEAARIKLKIFQWRYHDLPLRVVRDVKGGHVDV